MALIHTKEIYVFDSKIAGLQTLLAEVPAGQEVLILNSDQDGVLQIANALVGQTRFDAIHIFSHGYVGSLTLGNALLNQTTLSTYDTALAQIGSALTDTGDLLLYGCNVAQGDWGQDFITRIAVATGANVAASSDATGAASLGGNWTLEGRTGIIETVELASSAYQYVLPVESESNDTKATSTSLILGTPITASLASATDVDYFAVNISAPGLLTLNLDQPVGAYMGWATVSLENANGQLLGTYSNIDDAQNFQSCNFTSVLGCLTLIVIEISRYSDDSAINSLA